MLQSYFEDTENGGLVHAVSENWSTIVDPDKHAVEQFSAARAHVIGAMLSHDHEAISDAEQAVTGVIRRFEDTTNGGYYFSADRNWHIIKREKSLHQTGELFGVLMHLYEVSKNDDYLLRALAFLDTALERAWDSGDGGFFSLYTEDWKPALGIKDLATQATMLQHMNGSWKDGMDSPVGARSAGHRRQAEQFGSLLLDSCRDSVNGGFFTAFNADWTPAERNKDLDHLASFALALYFHYHNLGPSIWGPRKGSHAFTGRPYPAAYTYLGPAPATGPVSPEALRFGKAVIEIADLLVQQGWDNEHGGFYTTLTESCAPAEMGKLIDTQLSCLLALNTAYRLTGFERFQKKLAEAVQTFEEKCFDPESGGVYSSFTRDWQPTLREKVCGPNLMAGGILSMTAPVVSGMPVTRQTLRVWADPVCLHIEKNKTAHLVVTVQNQGFAPVQARIGGLSTPSRWMDPGDITCVLHPHEVKFFTINIVPPEAMPEGTYCYEITCMVSGEVGEYAAAGGTFIIE